ncbi:GspH/FimT family pseudopilin [Kaarinaea lacus]
MYRGDHNKGFTLIEMLVVLAIVAIIVTLSTPLSNIYRQNRVSTQVQEFVSALNVARNEAVSRGIPVSICIPNQTVNNDGDTVFTCDNSAGATADWSTGWIVFTDSDPSDCAIDTAAGDTIINQRNSMPSGFSLQVPATDCIKYTATGITPNTNGLWTLCDPSADVNLKRGINISVSGRAQILDAQRAVSEGIALADCPTS